LRLHRNDLPTCARAERAAVEAAGRPTRGVPPGAGGCAHPSVARAAAEVRAPEGVELEQVIVGRLLLVAQGFVNRKLEDEVGLRMAAVREGCTYLQARMRLLEFLDADAASLTRATVTSSCGRASPRGTSISIPARCGSCSNNANGAVPRTAPLALRSVVRLA